MKQRFSLIITLAFLMACGISTAADVGTPKPPADKPPADKPPAETKPGAGGRLKIEKDVVDVGDIVRGQIATAVFELQNTGEDVLKILDARPG